MSQFAQAALIEYYRQSGLSNKHLFPGTLEPGKSMIPVKAFLLVCISRLLITWWRTDKVEKGSLLSY